MAKFELCNPEIKKVAKGNNAGKEYLTGTLLNTLAILDRPTTHVEFNDRLVEMYKPFISAAKGGTAETDQELPERLRYITAHRVNWQPPKESIPFNRIYLTDVTDGTGKTHKAGDTICDRNGNPRLYESIVVFCKYFRDPDFPDKVSYYAGDEPDQKGQAYFGSFCIKATLPKTTVSDEDEGAYKAPTSTTSTKEEKPALPDGWRYNEQGIPEPIA